LGRACRDCVGEECQSYVRSCEAFSPDAGTYHGGDEEERSYKLSGYSSLQGGGGHVSLPRDRRYPFDGLLCWNQRD
jgi:hypothetical protein